MLLLDDMLARSIVLVAITLPATACAGTTSGRAAALPIGVARDGGDAVAYRVSLRRTKSSGPSFAVHIGRRGWACEGAAAGCLATKGN